MPKDLMQLLTTTLTLSEWVLLCMLYIVQTLQSVLMRKRLEAGRFAIIVKAQILVYQSQNYSVHQIG